MSSDDKEINCQVYADINDMTPMQKVMAASGGSDGEDDFSKWTFTYTKEYQLIMEGENGLTAKISCLDDANSRSSNSNHGTTIPISKWHTINVTTAAEGEDGEKDEGETKDSNTSQLALLSILNENISKYSSNLTDAHAVLLDKFSIKEIYSCFCTAI